MSFEANRQYILVPDADRVARRLRAAFPTVGDRWTLGVKTGADARACRIAWNAKSRIVEDVVKRLNSRPAAT